MSKGLIHYADLLGDIKTRIRQAQVKATLSANAEMILMYWDVGRLIEERQKLEGWGGGVIPRLAKDIRNELPEVKGFSERNLKRMTQFYCEYPGLMAIGPRPVAQLDNRSVDNKKGPLSAAQTSALNSGGGSILIGINDDGSPFDCDIDCVLAVDPANVTNKIYKYTDFQFHDFQIKGLSRNTHRVCAIIIGGVNIPLVFTEVGTYHLHSESFQYSD